jgi:FKBP-type peptidyl-prolyl cis-trans isomerase SlyD
MTVVMHLFLASRQRDSLLITFQRMFFMNTVKKNTVVTIRYSIRDTSGEILDEDQALEYLHGGYDNIFPLVEEAFHEKSVGDKIELKMDSEDAFGEEDEELVRVEAQEDIDVEDLKVGMVLESDDPQDGSVRLFRVLDIKEGQVVLDGNHPFAGVDVVFEGEILSIREASAEEIAHGHVHDKNAHND